MTPDERLRHYRACLLALSANGRAGDLLARAYEQLIEEAVRHYAEEANRRNGASDLA